MLDGLDWLEVPVSQVPRGTRRNDSSPGRTDNAGDLVWFDPYFFKIVDAATVRSCPRMTRTYNYELPVGLVLVSDTGVAHRFAEDSEPVPVVQVVADVSRIVVDTPMPSAIKPDVVPAGYLALAPVITLLYKEGVSIARVERISDDVDKVASMVQSSATPSAAA